MLSVRRSRSLFVRSSVHLPVAAIAMRKQPNNNTPTTQFSTSSTNHMPTTKENYYDNDEISGLSKSLEKVTLRDIQRERGNNVSERFRVKVKPRLEPPARGGFRGSRGRGHQYSRSTSRFSSRNDADSYDSNSKYERSSSSSSRNDADDESPIPPPLPTWYFFNSVYNKLPIEVEQNYRAAGILPYALIRNHNNAQQENDDSNSNSNYERSSSSSSSNNNNNNKTTKVYFLLGKEIRDRNTKGKESQVEYLFSEFGGKREGYEAVYDPRAHRKILKRIVVPEEEAEGEQQHIKFDEDSRDTAIREFDEEVGGLDRLFQMKGCAAKFKEQLGDYQQRKELPLGFLPNQVHQPFDPIIWNGSGQYVLYLLQVPFVENPTLLPPEERTKAASKTDLIWVDAEQILDLIEKRPSPANATVTDITGQHSVPLFPFTLRSLSTKGMEHVIRKLYNNRRINFD